MKPYSDSKLEGRGQVKAWAMVLEVSGGQTCRGWRLCLPEGGTVFGVDRSQLGKGSSYVASFLFGVCVCDHED